MYLLNILLVGDTQLRTSFTRILINIHTVLSAALHPELCVFEYVSIRVKQISCSKHSIAEVDHKGQAS